MARAVFRAAVPPLERTALVACMSQICEMAWTLKPSDLGLLVSVPPAVFGGDRA